ncbi:hypothetical protein [Paenibacillus riograndensis]|uniref:hypothetical protein n=1 Tax=Paenibacillus riograndensis TaxID=483937 RepID=UPI0005929D1D|nr:hypothetical protein [Paenibacillus riograndensis]
MEKQIQMVDSEDAAIARDYLAAVRAVLLEDGNPPLDLLGIRVTKKPWRFRRIQNKSPPNDRTKQLESLHLAQW